jgi:hypothetical protein
VKTIVLNDAYYFADALKKLIAGECVAIKSNKNGMMLCLHEYLGQPRLRYMGIKDTEVPDLTPDVYLGYWHLVIVDHRYLPE